MSAAQWNAENPVGTRVRYWPWTREGEGFESTTRSEAWTLPSGAPVVMVDGYPGGIYLTHLEVIS
ncbi:hypothetical protein KIH74_25500 [Kineosporia sp. J2-2]|uniref:Uncharacterized protein n=1 Tax=Kineosporia corallincola TaxID=2835133 RepID=A0ABS5TMK8_9ACTN|nr:hypothetical protein [Kineosporia corallincola]MBT0772326.1 hypothetical protein [Kineosporia corallincola]